MSIIATGQISIVDLADGKSLSCYITSNLPKTQISDPNPGGGVNPNWAGATPLKLTPVVFANQTALALNAPGLTVTWKRKEGIAAETVLTSGESVSGGILTVNANKLSSIASGLLTYLCYVNYTDPETMLSINVVSDITFSQIKTALDLSHKRVKNDATEVSSYYVKNHHRGIISTKTFERVQKIRTLRKNFEGHIPQYPYGETDIRCPLCGKPLVQRNTRGNYRNRLALGCFTEEGCGRFALRKNMMNAAMLEAYNSVKVEHLVTGTAKAEMTKTETAKSFLTMKKEQPKMETVEFYWLDELVEQIEIVEHKGEKDWKTRSPVSCWDAIIHWRCGLESILFMGRCFVESAAKPIRAEPLRSKGEERQTITTMHGTAVNGKKARKAMVVKDGRCGKRSWKSSSAWTRGFWWATIQALPRSLMSR